MWLRAVKGTCHRPSIRINRFMKPLSLFILICSIGLSSQAQSNGNFPLKLFPGQSTSSTSAQSDYTQPPTATTKKSAGASSARSILGSKNVMGNTQGLCFQPGIGWLRIPNNSVLSTQQFASGVGSSTTVTSALNGSLKHPSWLHGTISDQCPEGIINASTNTPIVHQLTSNEQIKASDLNAYTGNTNFGTQDWLNANAIVNPAKTTFPTQLSTRLNSNLSDNKHLTHGFSQNLPIDSVPEFEGRAYVSPIKLRRIMRNAPDMETRFKLRRLNEKQKEESNKYSRPHQSDNAKDRRTFDDEKVSKPASHR